MSEYQYTVDKKNKLSIIEGKNKVIIPGTFIVDSKNNLIYKLSWKQAWRQKYALPPKIVFAGKWDLDKKHNLVFTLRKSGALYKTKQIYFRGIIKEAKANSLSFALMSTPNQTVSQVQRFNLQGYWVADSYNRLSFMVQKSRARYDPITFKGQWKVRNNVLVYTYRKTSLITKKTEYSELVFKGFWRLEQDQRLIYYFNTDNNAGFSFKLLKGSNSIVAKEGLVRFRLGCGVRAKQEKVRSVELMGVWKLRNKTALSFQTRFGKRNVEVIRLGVSIPLSKNKKIKAELSGFKGRKPGLRVEFQERFLGKDGAFFMRANNKSQEAKIEAGVSIRF